MSRNASIDGGPEDYPQGRVGMSGAVRDVLTIAGIVGLLLVGMTEN